MGIALDSSFKLYSSVLMDDNKTFGNLIISTFPFEKARVLAVLLYLHFTEVKNLYTLFLGLKKKL